jgi:hypothetical protein
MLPLLLKIIVWFTAISYGIILLREAARLANRFHFIKVIGMIGLTAVLIYNHNFFYTIIKSSNFQIIKLIACLLAIRIPITFMLWLLSNNNNKTTNGIPGSYIGRQSNLGLRSPNRVVVNGVASLKINKAFIWALLLMLFCGNWLSHHLMLSAILLSSFYLSKFLIGIFKNLKIS